MEIIESINMLTWPAAAAIVGSVVTIVLGWFGYLRATKTPKPPVVAPPKLVDKTQVLHDRVSALKDIVSTLEGDFRVVQTRMNAMDKKVADHELRDLEDFKRLNEKVEKVMEIIVEMLRDGST